MKKTKYLIPVLALLFVVSSAFISDKKASIPEVIANEYLHSVSNLELTERFETQFYDIFDSVYEVNVHLNEAGTYYYTVYGTNSSNENVVEYFKTTKKEVLSEKYNYIEMNARTLGKKKCREATVWPPPTGKFCHPDNPGYICGVQIWPYGCFLY